MRPLLAAVVLVTATVVAGVGVASVGIPVIPVELAGHSVVTLQLDALQSLIEQVDRFLESVVDLVKTVRELFGGEGGG